MTRPEEGTPPLGEEFADISELGAETTDLIYRFRTALVELPEFQKAVAHTYLIASGNVPEWITFNRGEKTYSVQYSFQVRESKFSDMEDFEIEVFDEDLKKEEGLFLSTLSRGNVVKNSWGYVDAKEYSVVSLEHSVFLDGEETGGNSNNRTALAEGKKILEELRNPQGKVSVQVSDSASDKLPLD